MEAYIEDLERCGPMPDGRVNRTFTVGRARGVGPGSRFLTSADLDALPDFAQLFESAG